MRCIKSFYTLAYLRSQQRLKIPPNTTLEAKTVVKQENWKGNSVRGSNALCDATCVCVYMSSELGRKLKRRVSLISLKK